MAVDWQTRGEGACAHRFHRLTAAQAAAAAVPAEPGVCELEVDGELTDVVQAHDYYVVLSPGSDTSEKRLWRGRWTVEPAPEAV